MGNKNPSPSTRFKPGQSGNPLGGKLNNPELRAIRRLAAHEVAEIGSLILSKNMTKLQALVKDSLKNPDSKHSALKAWIARIAIKGMAKGDAHAMDVLLNRLIGRVKERVELSGAEGGPIRQLVGQMTPEERREELKRLRKIRKEAGED